MRRYFALIHKDADRDYGASFPDLPGLISVGATFDERATWALTPWRSPGGGGGVSLP